MNERGADDLILPLLQSSSGFLNSSFLGCALHRDIAAGDNLGRARRKRQADSQGLLHRDQAPGIHRPRGFLRAAVERGGRGIASEIGGAVQPTEHRGPGLGALGGDHGQAAQ
eukprot:scaffold168005_cov25-Prasinocladus_malaysianus.AAC.2